MAAKDGPVHPWPWVLSAVSASFMYVDVQENVLRRAFLHSLQNPNVEQRYAPHRLCAVFHLVASDVYSPRVCMLPI